MSRKRKKKGFSFLKLIFSIVGLLAVVAIVLAFMLYTGKGVNSNPVTKSINREATKKAVEKIASDELGKDVKMEDITSKMSEEDAEAVEDIVNKYADSGLLSEAAQSYMENNGDVREVYNELQDKVNPEDLALVQELYSKYAEEFGQ